VSPRDMWESDLDFLPMAAFFCIACVTVPALSILPTKAQTNASTAKDDITPLHFRILYCSLLAMAILVVGNSMMVLLQGTDNSEGLHEDNSADSGSSGPSYGIAFLLVTIWLGPITSLMYLPRRDCQEVELATVSPDYSGEENERSIRSNRSMMYNENVDGETDPIVGQEGEEEVVLLAAPSDEPDEASNRRVFPLQEDFTLFEMIRTPSAWLMLWTTTILVGAGTVETNNMGQMVEALGFHSKVTPASLSLFSVAQAGARVATGFISESALTWNVRGCCIDRGVSRPVFFVAASIIGCLAHLSLGLAKNEVLFVLGATLAGAAFGMVWPVIVLITGEVFGTRNVAANYMFFDGFTSAAGTLLLSKFVAQDVYEDHINANSPDPYTCIGTGCFRQTHMIVSALSLSCVVTSIGLLFTTRHVYNKRDA
jgi:hypothetical protein